MSSTTLAPTLYVARPRVARRPAVRVGSPSVGAVRLTRRGRLVVFLACLAMVCAAALFLGASSVATPESGAAAPTEVIVVAPGQTLWEIAAERSVDGEVRATMHRIEQLNALETSMLLAGQQLHVPLTD